MSIFVVVSVICHSISPVKYNLVSFVLQRSKNASRCTTGTAMEKLAARSWGL